MDPDREPWTVTEDWSGSDGNKHGIIYLEPRDRVSTCVGFRYLKALFEETPMALAPGCLTKQLSQLKQTDNFQGCQDG